LAGMRASATWKRVSQFWHWTIIEGPHTRVGVGDESLEVRA